MNQSPLLRALRSRSILLAFFLGFSSGLPYSLIEATLQVWLNDSHVDIKGIGLFAWVLFPYSLKFFWAPFLDQVRPPFLGRRRGWGIVTQLGLALTLLLLATVDPGAAPLLTAGLAILVGFFSASQDIVLDAHRRETLSDEQLGLGASLFVNGYRVGMTVSAVVPLYLSKHMAWSEVYTIMAAFIAVGVVALLLAEEPEVKGSQDRTFNGMFLNPFREFLTRENAILLLAFVFLYKIGDSMAAALRTKFLLDLGFDREVIASIAKVFGLVMGIGGGFAGAFLMIGLGLNRALWIFGVLQALATLSFWWLSKVGPEPWALAVTISIENGAVGMATSAYVAFLMSICDKRFSGTQYAALTSLMRLPSLAVSSMTGYFVSALGWSNFFLFCFFAAFPAFLILPKVAPWAGGRAKHA